MHYNNIKILFTINRLCTSTTIHVFNACHTHTQRVLPYSFFPLSPTRVYFSVAATSGHFSNVSLTLLWFLLATSAGEGGHGMRGEEREGPVWCALSYTCTEGLRFSLSKRRTQGVAFFFFFLPLSVVRDFPVLRRPDTQSTVRWKGLLWTKGAKKVAVPRASRVSLLSISLSISRALSFRGDESWICLLPGAGMTIM